MIIKKYQEVKAEPISDAGAEKVTIRWVISKDDGAKNFFMRVFEIEPGGCTPFHHHPWEHEMFVFEGEGCVIKEGKEHPITEGSVLFVPPDEEHQVKNTAHKTLKIVCLIPAQ